MASTAATARPAGVGSCLVCTAGLLGTSKRIAIGRALSRETGMRVFEDSCFVKLLQDAWLQEELGRQEKLGAGAPEKFLAELFRSRGRGTDTPFSPEAQIILIADQSSPEVRRNLLAKSAQTGDQEGTADVPGHYIDLLMQSYCEYIMAMGGANTTVIRISVAAVPALRGTNANEAGQAFATAVGEKIRLQRAATGVSSYESLPKRSVSDERPLSPPDSPDAKAADMWTRFRNEPAVAPLVI
jgi:hypothetical protein